MRFELNSDLMKTINATDIEALDEFDGVHDSANGAAVQDEGGFQGQDPESGSWLIEQRCERACAWYYLFVIFMYFCCHPTTADR